MQQGEQKGSSREEANEHGLSACPLRHRERRGAPTAGGGCPPRAGLAPAGEPEGENPRTRHSGRTHPRLCRNGCLSSRTAPAQAGSGRWSRHARRGPGDGSGPRCEPRGRHPALRGAGQAEGPPPYPARLTAEQPSRRSPAQRGGAQGRGQQHPARLPRPAAGRPARCAAQPHASGPRPGRRREGRAGEGRSRLLLPSRAPSQRAGPGSAAGGQDPQPKPASLPAHLSSGGVCLSRCGARASSAPLPAGPARSPQ